MNFNKITIFLFLIIFATNSVFSQKNNAKITYKKEIVLLINKKKDAENDGLVNDFGKTQNNLLKNVTFELSCNNYESIFKANKILDNEADFKGLKLAITLGGGGGIFYTDINKGNQLWEKEAFGQSFLIEKKTKDISWTLINETKKINSYTCYKAITKKRIRNRKGTFYKDIVAWYCPSIPLPFGPMEFCNLPGLILEVEMKGVRFYASEINLNFKENIIIKKPTKGKKVTYEELEKIGLKVMGDMEKMLKKKKKN